MEKRCSLTRLTWGPRPRANRPPESSSRSTAVIAVMPGERGKARAMAVPTLTREVAPATRAAWMKALEVVSAVQTESNPLSSIALASGPTACSGPPTGIP